MNHWIGGKACCVANRGAPEWCGIRPPVEAQATVDFASAAEVDQAVESAKRGLSRAGEPRLFRGAPKSMFKLRELVDANRRADRRIDHARAWQDVPDALGEVARGLENIEFACGIPNLLKGGFSEQASRGIDVYQIRQPLGVVAGITPFNFPAMVPMWMFAIAIACGNTFILKPSEKDPSVSLFLADLMKQAGVPDGVFNVVQGDKVAVDRLLEHPDVKAISFVGSTPVAKVHLRNSHPQRQARTGFRRREESHAGACPTPISGWPPMPLSPRLMDRRASAAWRFPSWSPWAAWPILWSTRSGDAWRIFKVGPGMEEGNEMGPLITREHRDRVASYVAMRPAEGAQVAVDGRKDAACQHDGFFLGSTLLDHVKPGMRCYRRRNFRAGAERGPRRQLR